MQIYSLISKELAEVEKEIERLLCDKPPAVYGMLWPFIRRGGKRLRPALLLLGCKALGGDVKKVIPLAVLVEIFHNFTLIHDDIADSSAFRRGKPTLHQEYGLGIALNSGDALYTLVWNRLFQLDLPSEKRAQILQLCGGAFAAVVEGQGQELAWYKNKRFDITPENYFSMIQGKTASLLGLSLQLGAILSDKPSFQHQLKTAGEKLGLAFQIHDDVLNVSGDFKKYKKRIGEDITEGKRTLMVIHTLKQASSSEKKKLISILSSGKYNDSSIKYTVKLFKKYGALENASAKALELVEEAKALLNELPDRPEKDALVELANFVISREE